MDVCSNLGAVGWPGALVLCVVAICLTTIAVLLMLRYWWPSGHHEYSSHGSW